MEEERIELLNKKIEQYDKLKDRLAYFGIAGIVSSGIVGVCRKEITYGTLVYSLSLVGTLIYIISSGCYVTNVINKKRNQAMNELHGYALEENKKYNKVKSKQKERIFHLS